MLRLLLTDLMLAVRGILRQPKRSMLAGIAVSGGVAALMLAGGFVEWNFWNYREATIAAQLGHVRVHQAGFSQSGQADPFAYRLPEASRELDEIRELPGVLAVAPRLSFTGLVSLEDSTVSFIGEGVEPGQEHAMSRGLSIRQGRGLGEEDVDGVLVGEGLAANLGLRVGDTIVLMANTEAGGVNAVEGTVQGIFSTISKVYDDAAVRMHRQAAMRLLRTSGAHAWVVLLERTEDTDRVYEALQSSYGGRGLEFSRWIDSADFYRKSRELYAKQVIVMKLIIAAIIILSITNSQMMSVIERTGEIGTAMALGSRRRIVLRRFLIEGLVLGVIGAGIGLAAGGALALLISWIGIPIPPPPGMAHGYDGEIMLSANIAVDAVVLAVVTTCAASLYPAWKASRMVIVDALRFNR